VLWLYSCMAEEHSAGTLQFLNKVYPVVDVSFEKSGASASLSVSCERSAHAIFENLPSDSFLGSQSFAASTKEGNQAGDPPSGTIRLSGLDHPILELKISSTSDDPESAVIFEGTAETVEYEGCDEVLRPSPFRLEIPRHKFAG
jgi:hypothetical protein